MIVAGGIRAVDEVRRELVKKDDDASHWAKGQTGLFVPLEEDIQLATVDILRLRPRSVGRGNQRNGADPFVIALAMVYDGVVVTEEHATNNLAKPHIPDVCQDLKVPCLSLVGFIQQQGWTF
jgi:Domain of unknown function (DUF4411)